jgi:hypothetical protein
MSPNKQKAKELMIELEGNEQIAQVATLLDVNCAARVKRTKEIIKEIKENYLADLEGADKWEFKIYSSLNYD